MVNVDHFGLCVRSGSPMCQCLRGFEPKSGEWRSGNWSCGCVRHRYLSCQGNSFTEIQGKHIDVFYHVSNIKPADSYEITSVNTEEKSQQSCLRNCYCTAFSHVTVIRCLVWNQELLDAVKFTVGGETLSLRLARSELREACNREGNSCKTSFLQLPTGHKGVHERDKK